MAWSVMGGTERGWLIRKPTAAFFLVVIAVAEGDGAGWERGSEERGDEEYEEKEAMKKAKHDEWVSEI